eukprot:1039328_1
MSVVALQADTSTDDHDRSREITKSPSSKSWWIVDAVKFLYNLPFTSIVRYVYKKEPLILFTVIGSNWILPSIVELIAPWYLCTHSILSETMTLQQDINQQLNAMDVSTIPIYVLYKIVGLTLYYSSLRTITRYFNGRINLRLRILMRRLIMEKIIYSEIDSLQNAYQTSLGYPVNPRALERTIMRDLNSSINVIFEQIPSTFKHSSRLSRNVYNLYLRRDKLDTVLIIYPFLYQFTREIVGAFTTWDMNDELTFRARKSKQLMSKLITNTVIGLNEIQIMNYDEYQLNKLNVLMDNFFKAKYSMSALFTDVMDDMRNHSILRWLCDVLLEIKLRNNRYNDDTLPTISHKEYNQMKAKCNSLFNSLTKLYRSINGIRYNINRQLYLKKLLYLPGFKDEEKQLKETRGFQYDIEFEFIEFEYVYFKYQQTDSSHANGDNEPTNITRQFIDDQVEITKESHANDTNDEDISEMKGEIVQTNSKEQEESTKHEFKLMVNETITFERGKTYGICGRNESGKTTLVDILCKLRKPLFMDCTVNGFISYDLVSRVEIRKQISYVSQTPFLFEGTVGENIHIANPDASIEEVKAAAELGGVFLSIQNESKSNGRGRGRGRRGRRGKGKRRGKRRKGKRTIATHMVEGIVNWRKHDESNQAMDDKQETKDGFMNYLLSFLWKMDDKQIDKHGSEQWSTADLYDMNKNKKKAKKKEPIDDDNWNTIDYKHERLNYQVKGNGNNVSGGLKQSIALSRVFLRRASKIVICDESFNSMDMIKKNAHIYPALFEFIAKHNMALIMISHDILECFNDLDHIIVLDHGVVHKQGTHQYLMDNSLLYTKLCGQKSKD